MKTSLTSGQLKNHSRINRCPNDLQNQEIRTPSCCRTQPVSLGTKLNQSKIADMPWQLPMNLWPIMKWFPVCMAFHTRSYKSEVSCLIIWTHDVPFQKITSSVAESHPAPGLLIIPNHLAPRRTSFSITQAISLHSENSETVHFMYISFIYQSKKWRVFCWCPLWTKAIYLSLQYFISSSPFVKRKLPGASRRWAPWFVVHPTGPGRPTSRLENLDLPSFTGTQKKVPGRNIRSFPRACSRLHSPSKSLDC